MINFLLIKANVKTSDTDMVTKMKESEFGMAKYSNYTVCNQYIRSFLQSENHAYESGFSPEEITSDEVGPNVIHVSGTRRLEPMVCYVFLSNIYMNHML